MSNHELAHLGVALLVALILAFLVLLAWRFTGWNHKRLRRKLRMSRQEIEAWGDSLQAAIFELSDKQGRKIPLRKFWSTYKIGNPERYFIVTYLTKRGALCASGTVMEHQSPSSENRGLQARLSRAIKRRTRELARYCRKRINYAFCRAPRSVILSDREWTRMAHTIDSGPKVSFVVQRMAQTMQYIRDNKGPINAVAVGRDATDIKQSSSRVDSPDTAKLLRELHAVLVADAARAPAHDADRILKYASEVEDELRAGEPQEERVSKIATRVKNAAEVLGAAMVSTRQLLDGWESLGIG